MSEGPLSVTDKLAKILYEWGSKTPLGAMAENLAAPAPEDLGPKGAIPKLMQWAHQRQARGFVPPASEGALPLGRTPTMGESVANAAALEGQRNPLLYNLGFTGGAPGEAAGGLGSMFLGAGAKRAPIREMVKAQEMSNRGHSAEDIYRSTATQGGGVPGISYGKEGQPRWEISDQGAKLDTSLFTPWRSDSDIKIFTGNLQDVFTHKELADNYRGILDRRAGIAIGPKLGGEGEFYPDSGKIVTYNPDLNTTMDSLLHELQHIVQKKEGFAPGASPDIMERRVKEKLLLPNIERMNQLFDEFTRKNPGRDPNDLFNTSTFRDLLKKNLDLEDLVKNDKAIMELYYRVAGEVEARNTEARKLMSLRQRAEISPRATEDRPMSQQIFLPQEDIFGPSTRR